MSRVCVNGECHLLEVMIGNRGETVCGRSKADSITVMHPAVWVPDRPGKADRVRWWYVPSCSAPGDEVMLPLPNKQPSSSSQ